MKKLADLPHDRPVATLMLLLSLMVLGMVAIFELPLDFMPIVEPPFVTVNVDYPGSHPLENLRQIVEPLEEEIATVSELRHLNSHAEAGRCNVTAQFDWSVDLNLKKLEIREAVDRALPRLPADIGQVRIETYQDGPGDGAILEARISAKQDLSESWELLERRLKRPLERIRGVARVDLGGVEPQQLRIEVDPLAMRRHGIDAGQLVEALDNEHVDLDAGAVRGDVLHYNVRSLGRFDSVEEIRALALGAGKVRIGDVAQVAIREQRVDYGRHLDREFAISLQIFKEASANTVDTIDGLMAQIAKIEQDPQLQGIEILVWNNAGDEIRRSLSGLRNAGLFGGVLVIAVMFLFLRRMSTTLVVAVAIPFSLLVTCGVMFIVGSQFDVLTMLGLMLGVGMLVDNAVVVIENIYRLQAQGMEPAEAARLGAREVSMAVVAATATTVCVWAWLFFIENSPMVIYLGQVALTICSAVICSLLISLTFIPLAAARFIPSKQLPPGFMARRMVPAYRHLLAWTLRHRMLTLLVLVLLAATAVYPIMRIEKSGEPTQRDVFAQIFLRSQDPTNKERMEEHVNRVEDWAEAQRETLGYKSLYSWFTDNGIAVVRLYLDSADASEARIAELTEAMRQGIKPIAGIQFEFGDDDWWRRGSGDRRFVSIAVHGEDPEYLSRLAQEIQGQVRYAEGLIDTWGAAAQGQQEARVLVDPEKARALGVTPSQVADIVSLTYRGRNLRRFHSGSAELEMLLALPEDAQPGVASLEDLEIPRLDGDSVPLGAVAEVTLARIDPQIERENRQTTTWITAEFDKEVTTEEAQERVRQALVPLHLPEGYSWDWGQWGRQHDDGLEVMAMGVTLSLCAVVLLMAALFESFSQPLAILITLPLAFFGGFWLLWLMGYELDVVGFMGVIILIGIVVNNGIVLVDHVNQLRSRGVARHEALIQGCGDRLRPVLMTAISTIVGLLPLAFSDFTVATAYIDSLAIAVIGGLTTSTLFTLVGLPVWYTTLEDLGQGIARALPHRARRGKGVSPEGLAAGG